MNRRAQQIMMEKRKERAALIHIVPRSDSMRARCGLMVRGRRNNPLRSVTDLYAQRFADNWLGCPPSVCPTCFADWEGRP